MSEGWGGAAAGTALKGCLRSVLDWFYPRHCCHCGVALDGTEGNLLCRRCYDALVECRISGRVCAVCGLPLAGEPSADSLCMRCLGQERYFERARAFFTYAGPAVSLVKSYKFGGEFFVGPRLLKGLLRRGWLPEDVERPSGVLPVPLHPRRRRERGYDQALLLGRVLSRHFESPLLRRALVRARYTSRQTGLPMRRREDNVRGAFEVRRPESVRDRRLLLVDDVMTTGSTADECAKALKRSGAEEVQVLTLTRTAP